MGKIVPKPRFWALVAGGLVFAVLGAVVPGTEYLLWIYNAALLALLVFLAQAAKRQPPLGVERRADPVLSVRQANKVQISVENFTDQRLSLRVRDELPEDCVADRQEFQFSLAGGTRIDLGYVLTPLARGDAEFPCTFVRVLGPLGLAYFDFELPSTRQSVKVYPNVKAVRDFELLKNRGHLALAGLRKSRRRGISTEFESLRDYNEDDFRFIDWNSTARRGKLVVKNFEQERNQGVIVCFDVGRHMLSEVDDVQKLDHSLDAALMLLHTAERAGDQVGLLLFSDVVHRYIAPKRGRAQVAAILDAVYGVQAEPVQPDYATAFAYLATKWKRRSLVVLFTDAENEDQARELAEALGHVRRHHKLMVVRVGDPRLKELRRAEIVDDRSLFARAAATWYQTDRRKADALLSASRIESLEAEPDELSSALVARYAALKERAVI
ncbi:MAG: DUF58 domain-containing protein [Fimbriimonadaceae bacterium]|nr:DUF58 domain-containing protein [Fimbriimonadaceae bacterium]QYK56324.1 MAG: DUF58 domain-containing protein [Fimbriimonadaceae bacterium]